MTAMTTYVKPFHSPLIGPKKSFHDYELEHSFNKRLSCLVGVTVVSFIIGVAALSISVLLLLQSKIPSGTDQDALASMQQRIEYLERQVPSLVPTAPHGSPAHNGPTVPDFPRNEAPVTEDSEPNDKSVEDHQPSVEDVDEYNTPVEHVVEVEQKDPQTPVPEKEPEDFPVPSDPDLSVGYDDDEDHGEGSGDDECPVLSRPVCPVGYRICQTTHRCPRPVCCK